jgi:hypothetical protein
MRKLFGFVVALVAVLFLGMAYTTLARAETPSCESVLADQIAKLVESDSSKILEMQFELTALKLASETLKANRKTVEGYIKKQTALIAKLDDKDIRGQLRVLYRKNGEAEDTQRITDEVQKTVDKAKSGSYFKKATRFKNKDLSAYVEAHYISDGNSIYDENDASILWLRSEISEGIEAKSFRGSQAANLQEVSTRVAQLTGIAGTTGQSAEEIDASISALQEVMGKEMSAITRKFTDEQKKSCSEMSTCATCGVDAAQNQVTDDHRQKALNRAIRLVGQKMILDDKVHEAAVQKVVDQLKSQGIAVERDPAEVKKADDDAERVKDKKTNPSPVPSTGPSATPKTTPSTTPSSAPSTKSTTPPKPKLIVKLKPKAPPSTTPSTTPSAAPSETPKK